MYLTFSPLIMAVPAMGGILTGRSGWMYRTPAIIVRVLALSSSFAIMLYVTARVTLVILAFWGMSEVPASGHISIEWSDFIPHI